MAYTVIQLRRGNSGEWTNSNPVLADGEIGIELDTGSAKIGDGITPWTSLPYFGGGGDVNSVNGKTGDVILNAEDVGAMPAGSSVTQHIILGAADPVPPETTTGTLIFRTA